MPVVQFPTKPSKTDVPLEMVEFNIEGGAIAMAGRVPIADAIQKLEEAADLLRAHMNRNQ